MLRWRPQQSASFYSWHCIMNKNAKLSNKLCFYQNNVQCQKLHQVFEVQSLSLDIGPQSFLHSFIALSIIRCSKSAQKFDVQVCQVTPVVVETTQLFLNQFKNFFIVSTDNWIRSLSLPKIISKCCELVSLVILMLAILFFKDSVRLCHRFWDMR